MNDIAVDGRLDNGNTLFTALSDLVESGCHVNIRLSGHAAGLVNLSTGWSLRRCTRADVVVDRTLHWRSSFHEKLTIFVEGTKTEALLGSADLSKTRWDTPSHHQLDTARYLFRRPTHEVGAAIRGPAVSDLADTLLKQMTAAADLRVATGMNALLGRHRQRYGSHCLPEIKIGIERDHEHGVSAQVLRTIPSRFRQSFPSTEMSIWKAYVNATFTAQRYVYIEDQFLWPSFDERAPGRHEVPDLLRLLVGAMQRGVDVIVVLPEPTHGPVRGIQLAHRHAAVETLRKAQRPNSGRAMIASVRRGKTPVFVHSKLLICDDEFALIGTANVNARSLFADFEVAVGVADHVTATQLRQLLWSEHLHVSPGEVASLKDAIELFDVSLRADLGNVWLYGRHPGKRIPRWVERSVWATVNPGAGRS